MAWPNRMSATITTVTLPAFGKLITALVGWLPATCQSSFQGLSTALNLTIAFPSYLSVSFNLSASIWIAIRLFIATKLACLIPLVRLVNF